MHPILASGRLLLLYLFGWALPISVAAGLAWYSGVKPASLFVFGLAVPYALICLTPWYVCRALPMREQNAPRILLNHLAAATIASALITRAAVLMLNDVFRPNIPLIFSTGVLLYLLSVALHYVYFAIVDSREALRREQEARVLAREAELKALKAQINPHFLFNSLHSISALTAIDPVQARDMCIRLSDFLRNTLRLGEKESIPLGEELALVNTYLAVEQVRFGARLRVERDIEPACETCRVPPLLLQPLVENCVKHGVAGLVDGGYIRIGIHRMAGSLQVRVENDFDPDSPAPRKSGMGLTNVANRITTRYGNRGRLDVSVDAGKHRVDLLIPCEE